MSNNLQWSPKDSEHVDLYKKHQSIKPIETDEFSRSESGQDEFYKFKRLHNPSKEYEVYLETEKAYMLAQKEANKHIDPMEKLARKIKMGIDLDRNDLSQWVTYNFNCFNSEEQKKVKEIKEWQIKYWRQQQFLIPAFWLVAFAQFKYTLKYGYVKNFFASSLVCYILAQWGTRTCNKYMFSYYSQLYNDYKDEVLSPEHRGKKLHSGKKSYQIDNEFTSSNFDELKQMIFNQKN